VRGDRRALLSATAAHELDVPTDSALRAVCIGGDTLFTLEVVRVSDQLACRVRAFALATGRERASSLLPYIKYDNGGGSLVAQGSRVAVGAEFGITVFDLDDAGFHACARLETEQDVCEARFLAPDVTIHWSIDRFVVTDLRSGETRQGPELEDIYGAIDRLAVAPTGRSMLGCGVRSARHLQDVYRIDLDTLDVVDLYEVAGDVMPAPLMDGRGHAYLVSGGCVHELDLERRTCRPLFDAARPSLRGGNVCRAWIDEDLHVSIVTCDEWLVLATHERGRVHARPFPRRVVAADRDDHGTLWTLDVEGRLTAIT
jgi:hypothetical protein